MPGGRARLFDPRRIGKELPPSNFNSSPPLGIYNYREPRTFSIPIPKNLLWLILPEADEITDLPLAPEHRFCYVSINWRLLGKIKLPKTFIFRVVFLCFPYAGRGGKKGGINQA